MKLSEPNAHDKRSIFYLVKVDKARFNRTVVPGDQLRLEASWKPQPGLELRAAYVHFNAGAAVRQAGGRDVDFAMLSASLRY